MPASTKPGRLETALTRMFMKSATVRRCRFVTERFQLVTLSGSALRGVRWNPGQKIQIAVGGWAYRTYTPLSWDAANGETQLLLSLHGGGPGSTWGRTLQEGDECTLLGPRDSVDLAALDRPALIFGDETSFGLAHAVRFTPRAGAGVSFVFEVGDENAARAVLDEMGIADATLIERTPADAHLPDVETAIVERVQAQSIQGCALTGKATSIQRMHKRLRLLGLGARQVRTRAYWAPGKVGLD